jgi:hypothetical protein
MALQSSVGPWPLFSFLILYTVCRLLGRGISPSQGHYLHTEQHKHRIKAHRHPCLERYSNPRSQRSSEGSSCLRPRGHSDRLHMFCCTTVVHFDWAVLRTYATGVSRFINIAACHNCLTAYWSNVISLGMSIDMEFCIDIGHVNIDMVLSVYSF